MRNFLLGTDVALRGAPSRSFRSPDDRQTIAGLARNLAALGDAAPGPTLKALFQNGILVAEGSAIARDERAWLCAWKSGPLAGAFHRSLRDVRFRTAEETAVLLARRASQRPPRP